MPDETRLLDHVYSMPMLLCKENFPWGGIGTCNFGWRFSTYSTTRISVDPGVRPPRYSLGLPVVSILRWGELQGPTPLPGRSSLLYVFHFRWSYCSRAGAGASKASTRSSRGISLESMKSGAIRGLIEAAEAYYCSIPVGPCTRCSCGGSPAVPE